MALLSHSHSSAQPISCQGNEFVSRNNPISVCDRDSHSFRSYWFPQKYHRYKNLHGIQLGREHYTKNGLYVFSIWTVLDGPWPVWIS